MEDCAKIVAEEEESLFKVREVQLPLNYHSVLALDTSCNILAVALEQTSEEGISDRDVICIINLVSNVDTIGNLSSRDCKMRKIAGFFPKA